MAAAQLAKLDVKHALLLTSAQSVILKSIVFGSQQMDNARVTDLVIGYSNQTLNGTANAGVNYY